MSLADRSGRWPVVESTELHRDDWVVVLRRDRIHAPDDDGETFARLVVDHPGAAFALAVDEEERVCLIRQYRHPAGGTFVEIPAGIQSGRQLRKRGAGMPVLQGRGRGDLVTEIVVETPTKLTARQKELLCEFRETETGEECPESAGFFSKLKSAFKG